MFRLATLMIELKLKSKIFLLGYLFFVTNFVTTGTLNGKALHSGRIVPV